MLKPVLVRGLVLGAATVFLALPPTSPASAFGDSPKRVDCSKKANKNHPSCKSHRDPVDDEIYHAAYWMAKQGNYAEARALLLRAANPSDPRILNYLGFTTRKLGDVDGALVYYRRALAINPDYTVARSYMGEAFLQKGDLTLAREQLGEIAQRCGTACMEYVELAAHISRFGQGQPTQPGSL